MWAQGEEQQGLFTHETENRSIAAINRGKTSGRSILFCLSHFTAAGKLKLFPGESNNVTGAICLNNLKARTALFEFRDCKGLTSHEAAGESVQHHSEQTRFILITFVKVHLPLLIKRRRYAICISAEF